MNIKIIINGKLSYLTSHIAFDLTFEFCFLINNHKPNCVQSLFSTKIFFRFGVRILSIVTTGASNDNEIAKAKRYERIK